MDLKMGQNINTQKTNLQWNMFASYQIQISPACDLDGPDQNISGTQEPLWSLTSQHSKQFPRMKWSNRTLKWHVSWNSKNVLQPLFHQCVALLHYYTLGILLLPPLQRSDIEHGDCTTCLRWRNLHQNSKNNRRFINASSTNHMFQPLKTT